MNALEKPLTVAALAGLWKRTLLCTPGLEDTTTRVAWLQGPSLFVDLRQPFDRPDFTHARALDNLSHEDCLWLARQQGFAGVFAEQDGVFWWHREIDLQPQAAQPDAGTLFWEGKTLVETGHFANYLEHWQRPPNCPATPSCAMRLRRRADGRAAILARAGEVFMVARARAVPLSGQCLADAVAAAPLALARELVDCEISLGEAATWRITRSSLPFREGAVFSLDGWDVEYREEACGS